MPCQSSSSYLQARRFAVAPMLAYTNRHARFFYRLLSKRALLYTEMIHTHAALGKKAEKELAFNRQELPLAVQLAGNDAGALAEAGLECQRRGYSAINLNIGCPSDKVRHGRFGACLMLQPQLVAEQVSLLASRVGIPVSIKCRLGVDEQDYSITLPDFLCRLQDAGCTEVIIHARKAMLAGLSPKQNRQVPPLDYPFVYGLRERFGGMHISLNGGITDLEQAQQHLRHVDGVMLGRAVLDRPILLAGVDNRFFSCSSQGQSLVHLLQHGYADYASEQQAAGVAAPPLMRPCMHLFKGQPGGGMFRRVLAQAHGRNVPFGQALGEALDCLG